jgi:hypothetical protein
MARYYFHIRDGKDIPDHEGTELSDVSMVRSEAITAAGEMLKDMGSAWDGHEWEMEVTDESGATVLTLRFQADGPKRAAA